jgi:DNA processing protein
VELSEGEKRIIGALSAQPRHIDEIARATGLEMATLSGLLTFMEIRGLLRHQPGMLYTLPDTAE